MWTEVRSERRMKVLFQGVGARPWILERRSCFARGMYNRLKEDDRSFGKQILTEVQWRLSALTSSEGFSAYRMVFGSNPAGLAGRQDKDGDPACAQNSSISRQFAQRWKLRMTL